MDQFSRYLPNMPQDSDYVLFCTQGPDYFLPTTACLVQDRLVIPTTAGGHDFNLGCSGSIYGLGLGEGLIFSGQASRLLLLTSGDLQQVLAFARSERAHNLRRRGGRYTADRR